ncbi:MAG: VOC family protein [Bacteroidota bacterium]
MNVSHILYKVKDLKQGVEQFRQQGFTVEYGTKKKYYNALIYFAEGPYLELVGNLKLPKVLKLILKIVGMGKVVERLDAWNHAKEGLIDVCLENYRTDLEEEKKVLKKFGQKYLERNSKRLDQKDRLLKYKVLFPFALDLPFLMTYFSVDPKPKTHIHSNGITGIKSISYGTKEEFIPLINALCKDETLKLFIGDGVKNLEYENV